MIAIGASNARGVDLGHHFAQVGLNKAPNPYVITAHGRDHLGCDVVALAQSVVVMPPLNAVRRPEGPATFG